MSMSYEDPQRDEIDRLYDLIESLIDDGECSFDHHGGCQEHGYLSLEPGEMCPHAQAKILIGDRKAFIYNPNFGDHLVCKCGHPYYRHFDTYDKMRPIGCKYCTCGSWEEPYEPRTQS